MYPSLIHFLFFLILFIPHEIDSKPQLDTDQTEEIVETLNQWNEHRSGFPMPACQQCQKLPKTELPNTFRWEQEDGPLLQQCATDLCGPASESPRYVFNNNIINKTDIDPEIARKFNEEIRPVIEAAFQTDQNHNKSTLELLQAILQNPQANLKPQEWDEWARKSSWRNTAMWMEQGMSESPPPINIVASKGTNSYHKNNNCSEEDCKTWVLDELSSLHQDLEKSISNNGQKQRFDRILNHCQSIYSVHIQSAQQAKRFRENINEYKDRFLGTVLASYSAQSRQSFTDYMNNTLNFRLRPEQDIKQQLVNNIRDEENTINDITSSNNKVTTLIENKERLADEYSMCSSSMETLYKSDSFTGSTNTVNVSYLSCHFHAHGKQVFAHELAHTLSYWFGKDRQHLDKPNKPSKTSYNHYMKLRNCANERYEVKNTNLYYGDEFRHDNDHFRTEEDMADLIAFQAFHNDTALSKCALLKSSKDGSEYESLQVLYQSIHPDTHSPHLLRVLMEAIHKKRKLPESCQKVVNLYSDRGISFKPCF